MNCSSPPSGVVVLGQRHRRKLLSSHSIWYAFRVPGEAAPKPAGSR